MHRHPDLAARLPDGRALRRRARQVKVTFDSVYVAPGTTYTGTWHADPAFSKSQGDPHDLAVVVFDRDVTGITPARLPKLGQLDSLAHGDAITPVGYGAQSVTMGKAARRSTTPTFATGPSAR